MAASSCRASGNRFLPRDIVVIEEVLIVGAMVDLVCVPKKHLACFETSVISVIPY